ncbi:hypothetical protein E0H73_01690 [Kribbella pittospori]|uniref:Uncharacterized protein n=1 Tax=Kribbella pittospori TaxID=722689 RepID=A0A4R0L1J2_9ACTN|nr:hypothetical protein [Kribbella pittospori]TCC65676.1 hypothetical protein E0H73_01690 [Kribbella pittospori]
MNRRYSALAMCFFAMGAVVLTAADASAMLKDPVRGSAAPPAAAYDWPDEGSGYPEPGSGYTTTPDCHWAYHPVCHEEASVVVPPVEATLGQSPPDNGGAEALQDGASALGGAGLAFGGMWLYRRHMSPV